jgi:hypothetical protein
VTGAFPSAVVISENADYHHFDDELIELTPDTADDFFRNNFCVRSDDYIQYGFDEKTSGVIKFYFRTREYAPTYGGLRVDITIQFSTRHIS